MKNHFPITDRQMSVPRSGMFRRVPFRMAAAALCCLALMYMPEVQAQSPQEFPNWQPFDCTRLSSTTFAAAENTWGYDILLDGKRVIHQPSVPGLPGTLGFRSREDAQKVADLVLAKICRGEMPPGVTAEELKALNVL